MLEIFYNRNFTVLFIAQLFTFAVAPTVIYSGGLIGSLLNDNLNWSTLPIASMVIGTALATYPASTLMQRMGRKFGFICGNFIALLGLLLSLVALSTYSFWLFCLSTTLAGMNLAFMQQYRFAVVESIDKTLASKAISLLILSGLFGALISLQVAPNSQHWFAVPFLGTYMFLMLFMILALAALLFYKNFDEVKKNQPVNSNKALFNEPKLYFSVMVGSLGYMSMSFIMTATPIYMKVILEYPAQWSSLVIQLHIAAMFLPSLISGSLITQFGLLRIIQVGILISILAMLTNLISSTFSFIIASLIFLGIGWNFMFVSATAYLTQHFNDHRKFKAQGINEITIFTGQAFVSIFSGWWLFSGGWTSLNLIFLPFLIILLIFSFNRRFKV